MKFIKHHFSFILYGVLMLLIALLDVVTGAQINVWILYAIPIGMVTWNLGQRPGLVMAATASVLLEAIGLFVGNPYTSGLYLAIACASKAIAYFGLVALLSALRKEVIERVVIPPKSRS